jgi:methionyl-tRNA formyltransferase
LKIFIRQKEKSNKLKAVVFAYSNMGIAGLDALARHGFDIRAVFTHEDDTQENCWFDSVKLWAERRDIPVYTEEGIASLYWIEKIQEFTPDIIFSFYYRKMIASEILAIPRLGAFNLHGSLLPKYRGRCPVNWVIINGEKITGVTLHRMVDKPDAGDIVGQKEISIDFQDTAKTLNDKMCRTAALLLDELLPGITRWQIPCRKQNLEDGSYFGGRKPEDGRIDWNKSATEIYNLIRAVTEPYPGAFAFREKQEKIIVWWAQPAEGLNNEIPGTVIITEEVLVQTGNGAIKLLHIEAAGKHFSSYDIVNYFRNGKVSRLI